MHFHPRSYRFSDILQNMCPIVFAPDFSTFLCVREGKKTFPRVLRIHKNEKKIWKKNLASRGFEPGLTGPKSAMLASQPQRNSIEKTTILERH